MSRVHGISAFGINDCAITPGGTCTTSGFYLADAVLPQRALGKIRTGDEAEQERVHSGLQWPPEARVNPDTPLRRVPIPVAWSLLVDAGDSPVHWNAGNGVSIPLAHIVAAHINGLLDENIQEQASTEKVVIAIPDHLDEYGQEALLQAFGANRNNISLLWRPVAAAMTWLDQISLMDLAENDYMLVIYVGPDGMEFTTFGLRAQNHEGKRYVLPVRNRPVRSPLPPGWEWACSLSNAADPICEKDYGAFWQTFTNFPETWAAIAGTGWDMNNLPQPWSTEIGWKQWNPLESLGTEALDCKVCQSAILRQLLKESCTIPPADRQSSGETWIEHLQNELKLAIGEREGRIRGAVLCGPLAPRNLPAWISDAELPLKASQVASPNTLWLANSCNDPIAEGAHLFGERLAAGKPTYLDTLPGFAMLTQRQGRLDWVDVVESKECEGGKPYSNEIPDRFFLEKSTSSMLVYLKKEIHEHTGVRPDRPTPQIYPVDMIEPIENRVKNFGNLDAFLNSSAWVDMQSFRDYAEEYAHWFYWKPAASKSPFRHGELIFPSIPKQNVKLTVNVEMRPASGLAKVEFLPEKEESLMGRSRTFDYSRMKPVAEEDLPELPLQWPETLQIQTTNDPRALDMDSIFNFTHLPDDKTNTEFLSRLESVKVALYNPVFTGVNSVPLKRINENGEAASIEGNRIIKQIIQKINSRFAVFTSDRTPIANKQKFIGRTSWLWAATPPAIVTYVEKYLRAHRGTRYDAYWNIMIESASRCFTKPEQFNLLFSAINERAVRGQGNKFPIQSMRSLSRILTYREDGWRGLDSTMSKRFAGAAADIICKEVGSENIHQRFFQGALLFLSLLRFRIGESSFMDPENSYDTITFDQIEGCMREAINIVQRRDNGNQADRIEKLIESIIEFMHSRGQSGIIADIAAFANV